VRITLCQKSYVGTLRRATNRRVQSVDHSAVTSATGTNGECDFDRDPALLHAVGASRGLCVETYSQRAMLADCEVQQTRSAQPADFSAVTSGTATAIVTI